MTKYIIAHDLGTSGNKGTLFTPDGELVRTVNHAYGVRIFDSNWAEQNPEDWWKAFCSTNKELLQGIDPSSAAAVSFSGQMMGCLCVDRHGRPLRDAIIWADMRASEEQQEIEQRIDHEEFYHLTGHRISSSYSVEKLMWLKKHEPDVYRNTYKMLNAKDFIVSRLTGKFITDYSDASSTNLFDISTFTWSEKIIEVTGIDPDKLPEAVPSTTIAGEVLGTVSSESGLPAGTQVVIGGGDGMCASVGAGSVAPGNMYNCLGSSSWVSITSEKPIFDTEMRTFNWAHVVPGLIGPCGTMQAAGLSYEWALQTLYTKELQSAGSKKEVLQLAESEIQSSPVLAKSLLFHPYLIGERSPRWNDRAKGSFIGLTSEHARPDMMRSVVEGIAMNLKIIFDILQAGRNITEMSVIGGLANGYSVRKILADVFDIDIVKIDRAEEASSIGAAVTAGVGVGLISDFSEVSKFIKAESREHPDKEASRQYRKAARIFDESYYALERVFDSLRNLSAESAADR